MDTEPMEMNLWLTIQKYILAINSYQLVMSAYLKILGNS